VIGVGNWECTPYEKELVNKVLDSGRLSYGPYSREFEKRFATLHNRQWGVLSNSGTSSLHVAVQAAKLINNWPDGAEILIPAVTFVATANVVYHNNLVPVPVDIEMDTYGMDLNQIRHHISDRTVGVLLVHLFGQPAKYTKYIAEMCRDTGLTLIEDSCETMLAIHYNIPVGAWGDIGCFSMYVAHLLVTGVGGISITNNLEYAKLMRSLVNHGRDGIYIAIDDNKEGAEQREVIERRFNFVRQGHSFRITELEAALGVAQLDTLQDQIIQRQLIAASLTINLQRHNDRLKLPYVAPGNTHSWMMYPIIYFGDKWELCDYLEQNGIETREMLPLVNQPCYDWDENNYPNAKLVNRHGFYIGCHHYMTTQQTAYVGEVFDQYFKEKG
jgi:perosamine synthetase